MYYVNTSIRLIPSEKSTNILYSNKNTITVITITTKVLVMTSDGLV